ncbi:hypothetical protein ACSBPU_06875 [Parapusillimonas sp. JC17]|uniref:hypothetical protein n=1 Tax=Parapusillimonas sp. JC17 TaxID=3445768 RepID=UPI003F9F51ED
MKNSKENDNDASSSVREPSSTAAKQHRTPQLLAALIVKAQREGHTMQHLARVLGVSYARLNQWRRGESHIGNAQRWVHEHAAGYLGIPVILVRVLAQNITLSDLLWPDQGDLALQVESGIHQLYDDSYIGGFVPPALLSASTSVKLFVLFLYRELNAPASAAMGRSSASWLSTLREAMSAEGGVRATGKL